MIQAIALTLGLLGAVPALVWAWLALARRHRGRRTLHFHRTHPVDIVLTLSGSTPSPPSIELVRPLTGIGQVLGLSEAVTFLAQHYASKEVRIHLSRHIANRLDQDEIVLGGPAKNEEAQRILRAIPKIFQFREFSYRDDPDPCLHLKDENGVVFDRESFEPEMHLGYPQRDLTLVALLTLPNERGQLRRTVLSSGLTSYGTFAGARFVFDDFGTMNKSQIRQLSGVRLRQPIDLFLVLEVEFSGPIMKRANPVYCCTKRCPKRLPTNANV